MTKSHTLPKICALITVLDTDDNNERHSRHGVRSWAAAIQEQAHPSVLSRTPGGNHQVTQPSSYATRDGDRAHRLLVGSSPTTDNTPMPSPLPRGNAHGPDQQVRDPLPSGSGAARARPGQRLWRRVEQARGVEGGAYVDGRGVAGAFEPSYIDLSATLGGHGDEVGGPVSILS